MFIQRAVIKIRRLAVGAVLLVPNLVSGLAPVSVNRGRTPGSTLIFPDFNPLNYHGVERSLPFKPETIRFIFGQCIKARYNKCARVPTAGPAPR